MNHIDHQVRVAAFEWLERQIGVRGDVLPREILAAGFEFRGNRVPLVAPQGIFKPKIIDLPLTITTTTQGPYNDSFGKDGLLKYRYRGTDPQHRDNRGLREALFQSVPLVYFHGVVPGKYLAVWPVYIVGDEPQTLTFTVAVDDRAAVNTDDHAVAETATGRRAYVTSIVRQRLHQRGFRERVLHAYREQCAICRLRHVELLDAAHIIPDADDEGLPVVNNGISLCKLHHAAYDRLFIGISPDYIVDVRADLLDEIDGPMLQHGLKELHGQSLILPRKSSDRPDRDRLDARYQLYRSAG